MRNIIIVLLVITITLIGISCSDVEKNSATAPSGQMKLQKTMLNFDVKTAETYLDLLARGMALALNSPLVQERLVDRIQLADTREKILDFSEWAAEMIAGKTVARRIIISGNLKSLDGETLTENGLFDIIAGFNPMLDIYFPVDKHRETWTNNRNNLLVAYNPLGIDDTEWEGVTAYTLSGEKRTLDPWNTPKEPVLVISLCEHHGNHSVEKKGFIDTDKNLIDDVLGASTRYGKCGGGGTKHKIWRIRVTDFRLMDDHEPWIAGDPEIYVKVRHPANDDNANWRITDFPDVNEEKLYDEGSYSWLPKTIYSEEYYHGNYNPAYNTDVEVWEDDGWGTGGDDEVETIWHYGIPSGQVTDFVHDWSLGYSGRAWYYGTNRDADLRMFVEIYEYYTY